MLKNSMQKPIVAAKLCIKTSETIRFSLYDNSYTDVHDV